MILKSVDKDACLEILRLASRLVPMYPKFRGFAVKLPFWKTKEFQDLAKEFGIGEFEFIQINEGSSYAGEGVFLYHLTILRFNAEPIYVEICNESLHEFGSVF
jgi:hypothetical protein